MSRRISPTPRQRSGAPCSISICVRRCSPRSWRWRRCDGRAVARSSTSPPPRASGAEPYGSPEYGAAKAGLIRFTSALAAVDGVRVNCIVPDWVATERVTAEERATMPPPIPLDTVADAVLTLIRDDTLAGRALVLLRGGATRID